GSSQRRTLARDFELDLSTLLRPSDEAELGPTSRPSGKRFFDAYRWVRYRFMTGEDVWQGAGGSVGRAFHGAGSCAAGVSWAFNNCGWPIRALPTPPGIRWVKYFFNDPAVTYAGNAGDAQLYIVGAPDLETYMRMAWGRTDAYLRTNDDVKLFAETLAP